MGKPVESDLPEIYGVEIELLLLLCQVSCC